MRKKIEKIVLEPFTRFFEMESSSGIILFFAALIAIFWANSPMSATYDGLWQHNIGFEIEDIFQISKPIFLWINDGLMAIFFFLIGLEIKRELMVGELSTFRKAAFPFFAAIGGIVFPIGVFFFMNDNPEAISGWGIPMATDIAFSLAILKLLGPRVPVGLKIFLTAFAIIDDLAAVMVIAIFYSSGIKWMLILISLALLVMLFMLSSVKFYSKYIFFIIGLVIWFLFLKSGIHPTIAGVLIAFTIPVRRGAGLGTYVEDTRDMLERLRPKGEYTYGPNQLLTPRQMNILHHIDSDTEKIQSPLQLLEHKLHGWVAFVILPIFAFSNAGVTVGGGAELDIALALTIGVSLILGKVLGITLFSILGVKLRLADLPENADYLYILGIGFLAGIGFTMSIFIANLAYMDPVLVASAKVGILGASFLAGLLGYIVLWARSRKTVKYVSD
ncbi:MAG: Na+/H+ antiporter NhaA [Candidatus Kapaibacterium sp.]